MQHARLRIAALAPTLLLATACSNLFGDDTPVSVQLYVQGTRTTPVTMHTRLARRQVTLSTATGSASTDVPLPGTGTRPVHVVLLAASGDTLGTATFDHRFERGSNHWIVANVGQRRPAGICTGPIILVPIRGAESADTLFVHHGSIPKDAIC